MSVSLPADKEELKQAISRILNLGEGETYSYRDSLGKMVTVTPRRGRDGSFEDLIKPSLRQ